MTLKEILSRRKEQAKNTPAQAVLPDTDNRVGDGPVIPTYIFSIPLNEFHSLFKDCTDF